MTFKIYNLRLSTSRKNDLYEFMLFNGTLKIKHIIIENNEMRRTRAEEVSLDRGRELYKDLLDMGYKKYQTKPLDHPVLFDVNVV
jgi:hypothetical protein